MVWFFILIFDKRMLWNIALTINGSVREKQFESKDNSEQDILYHSGSVCLSACCYFIIEFF